MTNKTKAYISVGIGSIFGVIGGLPNLTRVHGMGDAIGWLLGSVIGGTIMIFGYVFGVVYIKKWIAAALGLSQLTSIWAIFSEEDTLTGIIKAIFITFFIVMFAFLLVWIPGVGRGLYLLWNERSKPV